MAGALPGLKKRLDAVKLLEPVRRSSPSIELRYWHFYSCLTDGNTRYFPFCNTLPERVLCVPDLNNRCLQRL